VYILTPSTQQKIKGYKWQSFNPPAAQDKSGRFRGLVSHCRSQNWG